MLSIKNLEAGYGKVKVLHGINIEVPKGQVISLIGSNGAGKTTLLRTLSGLKSATHGSAQWNDHDLFSVKPEFNVRHGIAHVGEGKSVIAELSVEENLHLGAIWRKNKKEMKSTQSDVIELFPILGERIKQRADTLSGGERQMLAIGRALMSKPQLLLLDEPSLGLAPLVIEQIFQTIKSLRDQMSLTVVLVEQNALGALEIADTGIALNLGKVVVAGSAQSLLNDPAVRAAYLGY